MKNRVLLSIIIGLLFYSCNNLTNEDKLLLQIEDHFKIGKVNEKQVFLLIPLSGCGSCIDPSVQFIKENRNINNLYCIICDYGAKQAMITDNDTLSTNSKSLIIDKTGFLYQIIPDLNSPLLFFVDNNIVQDSFLLTSDNSYDAFDQILNFLK